MPMDWPPFYGVYLCQYILLTLAVFRTMIEPPHALNRHTVSHAAERWLVDIQMYAPRQSNHLLFFL